MRETLPPRGMNGINAGSAAWSRVLPLIPRFTILNFWNWEPWQKARTGREKLG
jgi:hypothetical protein